LNRKLSGSLETRREHRQVDTRISLRHQPAADKSEKQRIASRPTPIEISSEPGNDIDSAVATRGTESSHTQTHRSQCAHRNRNMFLKLWVANHRRDLANERQQERIDSVLQSELSHGIGAVAHDVVIAKQH
jgi:hypothetical protein